MDELKKQINDEIIRLTEIDRKKNVKKVMARVKECMVCHKMWLAGNSVAKTCSPKCRRLKWYREHNSHENI